MWRCDNLAESGTTSSKQRLDFFLCLLDEPVDVVIGEAGRDHECPRVTPSGDRFAWLNRDRRAVVRIGAGG
jgi:hypothetical protein